VIQKGFLLTVAIACASTGVPRSPAPPVPVVVELFTSEGCSSCPPADRLLIELVKTQPVKDALIIGLSEHVDYWNQLGWKDPFSDHLFSQRQSQYAAAAGTTDIYTPQMVVDGHDSFVGSDRVKALAAIARAAATPKAPIVLGWTTTTAPRKLTVQMTGGAAAAGAVVIAAVVEDGLSVSVRRGENSGQTLQHSAVTRRLVEIGRADRMGTFTHAGVRLDLDPGWRISNLRLVVLAYAESRHQIVAAGTVTP
jgi:hypothetical protein